MHEALPQLEQLRCVRPTKQLPRRMLTSSSLQLACGRGPLQQQREQSAATVSAPACRAERRHSAYHGAQRCAIPRAPPRCR